MFCILGWRSYPAGTVFRVKCNQYRGHAENLRCLGGSLCSTQAIGGYKTGEHFNCRVIFGIIRQKIKKENLILGLVPAVLAVIAGVYAYGELAGRVVSLERSHNNVTDKMEQAAQEILAEMKNFAVQEQTQWDKGFAKIIVMTTEPCDRLGTQWKPYKAMAGRFPLAAGKTEEQLDYRKVFVSGKMGGAYMHPLTDSELPPHQHSYVDYHFNNRRGGPHHGDDDDMDRHYIQTSRTTGPGPGEGKAHENMPPYLVVHFCQKT